MPLGRALGQRRGVERDSLRKRIQNYKFEIAYGTLGSVPHKGGDKTNLSQMLPVSCEIFQPSSWHVRQWHREWCGLSKTL